MRAKTWKLPGDYSLDSFPNNFTQKAPRPYLIDLAPYLVLFSRPDWQGKVNPLHYGIYLTSGRGAGWFEGVYCDADYTFVLVHRGSIGQTLGYRAVACLGFNVWIDNSVSVRQIQGVHGKPEKLRPLRWEKLLLKIAIDWARAQGFAKIKVIRAEDSAWFIPERKKTMFMKYDVTARRMRFKWNPEEKNYVLSLGNS